MNGFFSCTACECNVTSESDGVNTRDARSARGQAATAPGERVLTTAVALVSLSRASWRRSIGCSLLRREAVATASSRRRDRPPPSVTQVHPSADHAFPARTLQPLSAINFSSIAQARAAAVRRAARSRSRGSRASLAGHGCDELRHTTPGLSSQRARSTERADCSEGAKGSGPLRIGRGLAGTARSRAGPALRQALRAPRTPRAAFATSMSWV